MTLADFFEAIAKLSGWLVVVTSLWVMKKHQNNSPIARPVRISVRDRGVIDPRNHAGHSK
jgi:hypothetical protein